MLTVADNVLSVASDMVTEQRRVWADEETGGYKQWQKSGSA